MSTIMIVSLFLIYECDKETVLSLIDFFEKDASIKIYLQKRLWINLPKIL